MYDGIRLRAANSLFLLAATLLGAWLRLRELAVPSFWFDEIFHYNVATAAGRQPWWRWFTIFEIENGPLFYAGQLIGRISHSPEFSARIAPALCGIATIPVLWFAARAIGVHRAIPYAAAVLMAVSPLDVYYSREARPYALVVLVSAALILSLLRPAFRPFIALLIVAFYSGAMMAPMIASVVVAAAIVKWKARPWWIAAIACAILLAACYRPGSYPRQLSVPTVSGSELRGVFESFSVVAVEAGRSHRGTYAFAALALIGIVALMRASRRAGVVVTAAAALPVVIGVGATWLLHRPFGVRYVIGGLPGYLLLVAAGVGALSSLLRRADIAIAILIAVLLAREGWDAAIEEPFQKLDWRAVARAIVRHAHPNDAVIAADPWTYEQVGFYLKRMMPPVRLFDAGRTRTLGEVFAYQNTTSWLVVGDATSEFAQWACRFPVVLASPLQSFRLHYCPSAYYFLTDRSTAPEHRALLAAFEGSPSLSFGPGDEILLGDGWSGAERDGDRFSRWAVGQRAFVAIPAAHGGTDTMTIDVMPPSPRPQTMIVNINDVPIGAAALSPGRKRYTFSGAMKDGMNIVRFDFAYTVAPADLDPRSSDRRQLAARFFGLSVGAGGPPSTHLLRIDEGDAYLDETSAWRARGGRDLPPNIDRARLARLLGRMGFDPERAIPALTSNRVALADLAMTIADDSVCGDDAQFLRSLFAALLGREIAPSEMDEMMRELHRGLTRSDVAWRLGNSDQVRSQFQR